jgi:hypothetical protein
MQNGSLFRLQIERWNRFMRKLEGNLIAKDLKIGIVVG